MFDRLPNRIELGIFAALALICTAVVALVPKHDYAFMFAVMPVFFVAAVMGFLRSEKLKLRQTQTVERDEQLP
jgi:hypothetical protein